MADTGRASFLEHEMSDPMRTIDASGWQGASHRSMEIKKVENGFKVLAIFRVTKRGEERAYHDTEKREFVFYTLPEVLDFAQQYLSSKPEDLRE